MRKSRSSHRVRCSFGCIGLVCVLLFLHAHAVAQVISVGVKAGVPLTDVVRTAGDIGGFPYRAQMRRYTVGPVLDIQLVRGLGLELGALYKRFAQQGGQEQE